MCVHGKEYTRYAILLVVFLLLTGDLIARQQERFATRRLRVVAEKLSTCKIPMTVAGEYDISAFCPGKSVIVKIDRAGIVTDIGLKLFDEKMKSEYDHPVYDFIERYLLEMLLLETPADLERQLRDDKVKVFLGGLEIRKSKLSLASCVSGINERVDFAIQSDTVRYTAAWEGNGLSLGITFPKQYELIMGRDKIEMEDEFQRSFFLFPRMQVKKDSVPVSLLSATGNAGYYTRKGEYYLIPVLTSDRYYKTEKDSLAFIFFDDKHPGESLANLFLDGEHLEREVVMSVEHQKYGKKVDRFDIPVNWWVAFCKHEQCTPYFAIEKIDGKEITGTVIMVNQDLGYNHVLYYKCGMDIFTNPSASLKTYLYTYVPTHNVKNLLEEYKPR